jgi:hypothetical protein
MEKKACHVFAQARACIIDGLIEHFTASASISGTAANCAALPRWRFNKIYGK